MLKLPIMPTLMTNQNQQTQQISCPINQVWMASFNKTDLTVLVQHTLKQASWRPVLHTD